MKLKPIETMTDQTNEISQSPNPALERRQQLAALIPEAFSEGQLDVAALKRACGISRAGVEVHTKFDGAGKRADQSSTAGGAFESNRSTV